MKIKTLVIHPKDESTEYLSEIYAGKGWEIIDGITDKDALAEKIKNHDRIIMLGHGSELGLLSPEGYIIDESFGRLLRDKECVCIWCNADLFIKNYPLKGFYTGMIISEDIEAIVFSPEDFTDPQIDESNLLFARVIGQHIESKNMLQGVLEGYVSCKNNPIIDYNRKRLFVTPDSAYSANDKTIATERINVMAT